MTKNFFLLIKKILFSFFLLYAYNLIVQPLNLNIPINFITLGLTTIFGVPSLISLIIISVAIF